MLRHGYFVTQRPAGTTDSVGGAIIEATVVPLRRPRRFKALLFENRSFLLDELIVRGQYLDELHRVPRPPDGRVYALDVGANVGLFTLFANAILRARLHVIGFEPLDANRALCAANWKRAKLAHTVRPEALADRDETDAPIYLVSTTGATINRREAELYAEGRNKPLPEQAGTARLARLDTLFPELGIPRVDLMKIDIEGAEEWAITGGAETISRFRPLVLCTYEHHTNTSEALIALFEAFGGYSVRQDHELRLLTFEPQR